MGVTLNNRALVTVYGGSGFLGRHLVRAIAETGARVRVAVRRPDLAGHLQPLGGVGQIVPVQANVRFPESLVAAAEDADAVVNLVGILFASGKQTFKSVQDEGTGNVAKAAKAAGVKTMVHVSAIGADANSSSVYAQSKAAGEAAVKEVYPDATIVRPSVVFGPEDDFFNRFGAMAQFFPALPLIGGGHTKFQPVYVGDVAQTLIAAIEGRTKTEAPYELGGPEVLTMRDIMERVLAYSMRSRALVSLPTWFAKLQGFCLKWLPKPPITVDQVKLLEMDNVVSEAAVKAGLTLQGLGIEPTDVETIVPPYMEQYRPRGQFSVYKPTDAAAPNGG